MNQTVGNPSATLSMNGSFQAENITAVWKWPSDGSMVAVFLVTAVLFNFSVLILFFTKKLLESPFSVYLINVIQANLVQNVGGSLWIIDYLTYAWYPGNFLCEIQKYADWVSTAVLLHAHVLISVNRLWALFSPISYKAKHTRQTAVILCIASFSYVHFLVVPILILDAIAYRKVDPGPCAVNYHGIKVMETYGAVLDGLVYEFPIFFILFSYPVMCLRWKLQKKVTAKLQQKSNAETSVATNQMDRSALRKDVSHRVESTLTGKPTKPVSSRPSNFFVVLTAATLNCVICWTPAKVNSILNSAGIMCPLLEEIDGILYSLQGTLDPILFVLTFKELREVVNTLPCFRWTGSLRVRKK